MANVIVTRETLDQYRTLGVQYSTGSAQAMTEIGDSLGQLGESIEKQAQKKFLLDASVTMKEQLFKIEQEHYGNPEAMQQAFNSFKDGYLGKLENEEAVSLLSEQYLSETQPAMRRALNAKRTRLDNEVKEKALVAVGMSQKVLTDSLPDLWSDDPAIVEEAARQIQTQAVTMQEAINIKDSEGNPLISPEKRAELMLELQGIESFVGGGQNPIDAVMKNEGGFVAQDGASGAPAIYGINQKWHPEAYAQAKKLTDEKGEAAGKAYAEEFYKKEYYDKYKIGELPQEVQTVVMDGVVNHSSKFAEKLIEAAKSGEPKEVLLEMRQAEYNRLATQNPEKYGKSLKGWENRLKNIAGMPEVIRKSFEKKLDEKMAQDPAKFMQALDGGEYDKFLDAKTKEKYRKDSASMFKDAEEREKIKRVALAAGQDQEIYNQFVSNAPDMLQKIEDYRSAGGNPELAEYMRANYLKANPLPAGEESQIYTGLLDRVNQLGIRTVKGKVEIGDKEATLEGLVRLQEEIMKQAVRGVGGLTPMLKKLSPAILEKAKRERGKDDLGVDSFFGFFRETEAYDTGYAQIQGWIEGQGKEKDYALKADMMREFITRADAIPEEIKNDETLYKQTQESLARDVIAQHASKGMKAIPVAAIQHLIANPNTANQFDEMFGSGAAKRVLGK